MGFIVLLSLGLLFYYTFQPPWFKRSLIIGPCFFFLGFGLGKVDQILPKQHYSKLVALEQKATIEFELEQRLRPTNLYDRYYIRLKKYNNTKTTGRLLLQLKNSYTINNAELLVVDGAWVESFKPISVRYLLLHNNHKVNLERLLKKHSIKVVLIDGSNLPYYIARWKESLTREKIAFHVTAEQGVYEFNLENEE